MRDRGDRPGQKSGSANAGWFKKGGDPRQGVGKKGRSGRPSNHFKKLMRKHALSGALGKKFRRIMRGAVDNDSTFLAAFKFAAEHGFGKPTETQELHVKGSLEQLLTASREAELATRRPKKRRKRDE
jgi:hypothetical protein